MKVTVYLDTDGWRWRLKAGNREIMASGEAYTRRHNAEKAVAKLFGTTDPVQVEVNDGRTISTYTLRDVEPVVVRVEVPELSYDDAINPATGVPWGES